ncbi:exocyst complex subunit sec6 [Vairimorpha apis BRL 01]|uniref:Exocyst complex subunit sec6 n=1 Tax=Vairimorpha apis BRL 01 TaxID=1037528 RepID=T0KZA4_9MICR|nr:exocyst complex subunit sec6 [Vairimorpha apis BRL 01]
MEEKALKEISEKIKHPSDLINKIKSIQNENNELFYYNESCLSSKILKFQTLFKQIVEDITKMEEMYSNFLKDKNKTVKILNDFLILIKNYKTVKTICIAHSNLLKVQLFTEKLNSIYDSVQNDDIEIYHSKVFDLEDFMFDLEFYNHDLNREDSIEVSKSINHIKKKF